MESYLSKRLQSLAESQTLAMNQKTKDLQAKGFDIVNLTAGEPDFFTPDHIKAAAKQAVDANYSFYTPVDGYADLRKAIVDKLKRENGLDYKPEQITVSNGAKHSLANAIMSIVDDGDEVIIPAPYWVSYSELVKLAGGKSVIVKTTIEGGFKMTAAQLENAITPKTKMLILCSPSNPTGSVYSKAELAALAEVVGRHDRIFVVSDEIYEHINFVGGHESIAQFAGIKDRVVLINGVSKAYAMTGYRIGYLAAPLWLVKACSKLQGQFTSNPSSIAQRAAVAALTQDNTPTKEMTVAFRRRRDLVISWLNDMPGVRCNVPEGAFYVFPDVSSFFGKSDGSVTVNSDMDMCLYLLDKALVSGVPGGAFGEPTCIRLSYATSDANLEKAMKSMKEALAKLK
ncbi:MAG: pyridoxal phosphate-dependent aminotransferase [Prevotellaceae bacterium]|jgi:aspartate aminotransferase|nr:pyridoxal phosphate-dependent aminotransferase [Prevotellaceae bacterium]